MKNTILIIAMLLVLANAGFALAAFSIPETTINLTSPAPGTATGMMTLTNTGASQISVLGLLYPTMHCLTDSSETLSINSSYNFPVILPANISIPFSFFVNIPSSQFSCTYFTGLVVQSSAGDGGVNVYLNVTPRSGINIQNNTASLLRNLSDSKMMNVALVNTGNTDLFFTYSYTNFSKGGIVLVNGGIGALLLRHGTSQNIPIFLSIPQGASDGTYSSVLTLTGDINRTATLTVGVSSPVRDISLPLFEMPSGDRNTTVTQTFTIKNTGDYDLSNVDVTTNAASKYNVTISNVASFLPSGAQMDVSVSVFIPAGESTLNHSIGTVYFTSDKINKNTPLMLDVISNLEIEYVTFKMNDREKKISSSDTTFDDNNNYPGSTFSASVRICNRFSNKDDTIDGISIDSTFSQVDDNNDDISGSINSFDLDGNKCTERTISFDKNKISYLLDEGTYDLEITATGEDSTNAQQQASWTIPVVIYRSGNAKLILSKVSVSPSEITCGRDVTIRATGYSIGKKDSNALLKIYNPALGINIQKAFQIGEDPSQDCNALDEPDSKCILFDGTFQATLPDVLQVGDYPVIFSTSTNTNDLKDNQTATLKISGCSGQTPSTPSAPSAPSTPSTPSAPITGTTNISIGGGSAGTTISGGSTGTSSAGTSGTPVRIRQLSSDDTLATAGIIAGIVAAVIVIIAVVVALLRKPSA